MNRKRAIFGRRLCACVSLILIVVVVAGWCFVAAVRKTDMQLWQLHEAARAMECYFRLEGRWPSALGDLECEGIVRLVGPSSFTVISQSCGRIVGYEGVVVDTGRVRLGWNGVSVDGRATLVALQPPGNRIVEERAKLLSDQLREIAGENAASTPTDR
jgi:hypothetical protein